MWQTGQEIVSFTANALTIALALVAVYGLFFQRDKLGRFFQVFDNAFLGQQSYKIRETIIELNRLNYENKEDRIEITNLIGELCGKIKPLTSNYCDSS